MTCCDGPAQLSCPQSCKGKIKKAWRGIAQSHEKGTAKARKLNHVAERPETLGQRLAVKAQELHKRAVEATSSFEHIVQQLQQARTNPSAMANAQRAQAVVHAAQFEARIAAARASVDWTVPGFAALSGIGCLSSPPISEKLFRGGSTTSVPKRYAFEFCPFANVSQREDGPLAWKRAEDAAKDGESRNVSDVFVSINSADSDDKERATWSPLGFFGGFIPLTALDVHAWASGAIEAPRPSLPPLVYRPTPSDTGSGLADVAAFFELPWDACQSSPGAPSASRRVYVVHVCPGLTPRQHYAAAALVRRTWPARAPQGEAWDVPTGTGNRQDVTDASVIHVLEDGLCTYFLFVSTALACTREIAVAALQAST